MDEDRLHGLTANAYACVECFILYKDLHEVAAARQSVIELLEAAIPAKIKPFHECGPVINAGVVIAPSFKTGMRGRKRSRTINLEPSGRIASRPCCQKRLTDQRPDTFT